MIHLNRGVLTFFHHIWTYKIASLGMTPNSIGVIFCVTIRRQLLLSDYTVDVLRSNVRFTNLLLHYQASVLDSEPGLNTPHS